MTMAVAQWESSVAELWERCDSLDRDEGIAAMRELVKACPVADGRAAFELAGMYGSTLRNLGRLDEAIDVLRAAPTHESTGSAPRVVLALALHSAGRTDEALQVAIEAQLDTLPRYQRSMRDYAAALTASPDTGEPTTH